jgi:hypothetical protein
MCESTYIIKTKLKSAILASSIERGKLCTCNDVQHRSVPPTVHVRRWLHPGRHEIYTQDRSAGARDKNEL